jgi:hypothetical protein
MGGIKPLQSVINTNYSVDITYSSCTNCKIPQLPLYKLTALRIYAKLQAFRKMYCLKRSLSFHNVKIINKFSIAW